MITLDFAGGVDLGDLPPVDGGEVSNKFRIPLRVPAPSKVLNFVEVEPAVIDHGFVLNMINRVAGDTSAPILEPRKPADLINDIKSLRAHAAASVVVDRPQERTYSPDAADAEVVKEENDSNRTASVLKAIREEGTGTQAAIANLSSGLLSDTANIQTVLGAIFNRKVGAEDRFQKAMLAEQIKQHAILAELLAVDRQAVELAHQIGIKLIHNTSLPDAVKGTSAERDVVRDEDVSHRLKTALFNGHLEDTLKNVNSAMLGKINKGASNTWGKINPIVARGEDGAPVTRLQSLFGKGVGAVSGAGKTAAETASNLNEIRKNEGVLAAGKAGLKGIWGTVKDTTNRGAETVVNAASDVVNAASGVRASYKGNGGLLANIGAGLRKAKNDVLNEGGFVHGLAVKPITEGVKGFVAGVTEGVSAKTPAESLAAITKALEEGVPNDIGKLHETVKDIYLKMGCLCPNINVANIKRKDKVAKEKTEKDKAAAAERKIDDDIALRNQAKLIKQAERAAEGSREERNARAEKTFDNVIDKILTRIGIRRKDVTADPTTDTEVTEAESTTIPDDKVAAEGKTNGTEYEAASPANPTEDTIAKVEEATSGKDKVATEADATHTSHKKGHTEHSNLNLLPEFRKLKKYVSTTLEDKVIPPGEEILTDRAGQQVALLAQILDVQRDVARSQGKGSKDDVGGMFEGILGKAGLLALPTMVGGFVAVLPEILAGLAAAAVAGGIAYYHEEIGNAIGKGVDWVKNGVADTAANLFGGKSDHQKEMEAEAAKIAKNGEIPVSIKAAEYQRAHQATIDKSIDNALFPERARYPNAVPKLPDRVDANDTGDSGDEVTVYTTPDTLSGTIDPKLHNQNVVAYTGELKDAGGEAYFMPDEVNPPYIIGTSKALKRFPLLTRATRGNFIGMAYEYNKLTGKKLYVVDSYRTYQEQVELYRTKPKGKASIPGNSMHGFGLALDVDSKSGNLAECEKLGLIRKYGFWRAIPGERWHIEPIAITPYVNKIISHATDPASLDAIIMGGRGNGGGGPGVAGKGLPRDSAMFASITAANVTVRTAGSYEDVPVGPTGNTTNVSTSTGGNTSKSTTASSGVAGPVGAVGAQGVAGTGFLSSSMKAVASAAGVNSADGGGDSAGVGASSGTAGPISKDLKTNATRFIKEFKKYGWSDAAALGVAANAKQESEFNPHTEGDKVINGKPVGRELRAYGLFQWRLNRRFKDFESFIGKPMEQSTFEDQVKYLDHELRKGSDAFAKKAGVAIANAKTAEEAAFDFMRYFERPKYPEKERGIRNNQIATIRKALGGTVPAAGATSTASMGETTAPNTESRVGVPPPAPPPANSLLARISGRSPATVESAPIAPMGGAPAAAYTPTSPVPSSPSTPTAAIYDKPEITNILDKSYKVQVDMLTELRKMTAVLNPSSKLDVASKSNLAKTDTKVDTTPVPSKQASIPTTVYSGNTASTRL